MIALKEWKQANPDTPHTLVWAADAGSFGHKGGGVYGNADDCLVVREEKTFRLNAPDFRILHVWHPIICKSLEE